MTITATDLKTVLGFPLGDAKKLEEALSRLKMRIDILQRSSQQSIDPSQFPSFSHQSPLSFSSSSSPSPSPSSPISSVQTGRLSVSQLLQQSQIMTERVFADQWQQQQQQQPPSFPPAQQQMTFFPPPYEGQKPPTFSSAGSSREETAMVAQISEEVREIAMQVRFLNQKIDTLSQQLADHTSSSNAQLHNLTQLVETILRNSNKKTEPSVEDKKMDDLIKRSSSASLDFSNFTSPSPSSSSSAAHVLQATVYNQTPSYSSSAPPVDQYSTPVHPLSGQEDLAMQTEVDLSEQRLSNLPSTILVTPNKIKKLNFSENRLKAIPPTISLLDRLEELDFSSNQVSIIPFEISALRSLRKFNLRNNKLGSLPKAVGALVNLEELNISVNSFTTIPLTIKLLSSLTYLDVSHNQLSSLPDVLCEVKTLTSLNARSNKLSQLPDSIGNISELRHLDVSDNQISALPNSLKLLKRLAFFRISQNPLQKPLESLPGLSESSPEAAAQAIQSFGW